MKIPNPMANKALWWAAALLLLAGLGAGWYASYEMEGAWVTQAKSQARTIIQSIERHPKHITDIASLGAAGFDVVGIYDAEMHLLARSAGAANRPDDDSGPSAIRAVQDSGGSMQTGNALEIVMPVGPKGSPATLVHLSFPLQQLRIAQRRIYWFAGLLSVLGVVVVVVYFMVADTRLRRQRKLIENVLQPSTASFRGPYDDELTALERRLRDLGPQWDGLSRQAQDEAALRELVLKSITEGLVAVNREMHITFCNDRFLEYAGVKANAPIGQHILTVVRTPEFLTVLTAALKDEEPHRIRIDQHGRRLEVQASPMILGTGTTSGVLAALHDVTELERLERVRRDFVTNISHELRTPLAAIQGYAETLLEGDLVTPTAPEHRFLETIQRHAQRLGRVAADLATLSEIEGPPGNQPLEPISLRMVVASACAAIERELQDRDVKLVATEVPDVEVYGHRLRFEQALVNLLDNGIRFNRPGGEVRVDAVMQGDSSVQVTVADTGIGIPSDQLGRIFERFYRVDKARSRETGGTGLGLSIVRHVAEQMHGRVMVESTLGKGTKFTLLLPAARYHTADGTPVERAADPQPAADGEAD